MLRRGRGIGAVSCTCVHARWRAPVAGSGRPAASGSTTAARRSAALARRTAAKRLDLAAVGGNAADAGLALVEVSSNLHGENSLSRRTWRSVAC